MANQIVSYTVKTTASGTTYTPNYAGGGTGGTSYTLNPNPKSGESFMKPVSTSSETSAITVPQGFHTTDNEYQLSYNPTYKTFGETFTSQKLVPTPAVTYQIGGRTIYGGSAEAAQRGLAGGYAESGSSNAPYYKFSSDWTPVSKEGQITLPSNRTATPPDVKSDAVQPGITTNTAAAIANAASPGVAVSSVLNNALIPFAGTGGTSTKEGYEAQQFYQNSNVNAILGESKLNMEQVVGQVSSTGQPWGTVSAFGLGSVVFSKTGSGVQWVYTPAPGKAVPERMTIIDTEKGTEVSRYKPGETTPYISEMLPVGSMFATQKDYETWMKGQTFTGQYEKELAKEYVWTPFGSIQAGSLMATQLPGGIPAYALVPVVGQIPGAITFGQAIAGGIKEQGATQFFSAWGGEVSKRASVFETGGVSLLSPDVRAAAGRGASEVWENKETIAGQALTFGLVSGTIGALNLHAATQAALKEPQGPQVVVEYQRQVGGGAAENIRVAEEYGGKGAEIEANRVIYAKSPEGYQIQMPGVLDKDVYEQFMARQAGANIKLQDVGETGFTTEFGGGSQYSKFLDVKYSGGVFSQAEGITTGTPVDTTFAYAIGNAPKGIAGVGAEYEITGQVAYLLKEQVFSTALKLEGEPQLRGGVAGAFGFTEERGPAQANIPEEMSWTDIFKAEKAAEFSKYFGAAASGEEKAFAGMQDVFPNYPTTRGVVSEPSGPIDLSMKEPVIEGKFLNPPIPEGLIKQAPGEPSTPVHITGAIDVLPTGTSGMSKAVTGGYGGEVAQKLIGRIETQSWLITDARQIEGGATITGGAAIMKDVSFLPAVFVTKEEIQMLPYTTQQPSEAPARGGIITKAIPFALTDVGTGTRQGNLISEAPALIVSGTGRTVETYAGTNLLPTPKEWQITPQKESGRILTAWEFITPSEKANTGQIPGIVELPAFGTATAQITQEMTPGKPGQPIKNEIPPPETPRWFPTSKAGGGGGIGGFLGIGGISGRTKNVERFPWSDIISKSVSEISFGKATSPSKKTAKLEFMKSGGLRVPTAEMLAGFGKMVQKKKRKRR